MMDKKSKKTSMKNPAGKRLPSLEKSNSRSVPHETTPQPPLLRNGGHGDSSLVVSLTPTQEGVDHPCSDSPRPEASQSVDPSVGLRAVKAPENTVLESANVVPSESVLSWPLGGVTLHLWRGAIARW